MNPLRRGYHVLSLIEISASVDEREGIGSPCFCPRSIIGLGLAVGGFAQTLAGRVHSRRVLPRVVYLEENPQKQQKETE